MIDFSKPITTRGGLEVRIYAQDGGGPRSIHGAFKNSDGWIHNTWYPDGGWLNGRKDAIDLINPPARIKRTVWVNFYKTELNTVAHTSKKSADAMGRGLTERIACVKIDIDCLEGEGL